MAVQDDRLVPVTTLFNVAEAYLVKGLLENEGIEVFLFDEHAAAYTPCVVGGVRLMVKISDVERAREVLNNLEQ